MYIDYNNLYEEVKLFIKEHYKPGQYLFNEDLVNHFMINEKEAKDILYDLYMDYVLDVSYTYKCPNCNLINREKYADVQYIPDIIVRCEYCGYEPVDNLAFLYVVREHWCRN